MKRFRLGWSAFALALGLCSSSPALAASDFSGEYDIIVKCGLGNGYGKLKVVSAGGDKYSIQGSSRGGVYSGSISGRSVRMQFVGSGNEANFSGTVNGPGVFAGELTQKSSFGGNCSWTATRKGGAAAPKQAAQRPEGSIDVDCPISIRSDGKGGAYRAANPYKKTSVLAVIDTIDQVKACGRDVETIIAGDKSHLLYSYFSTAPKKIFQCTTGKKNSGCTAKILRAKFGKAC